MPDSALAAARDNTIFPVETFGDALIVSPKGDKAGFGEADFRVESGRVADALRAPELKHLVVDFSLTNYVGGDVVEVLEGWADGVRGRGGRAVACEVSADMRRGLSVSRGRPAARSPAPAAPAAPAATSAAPARDDRRGDSAGGLIDFGPADPDDRGRGRDDDGGGGGDGGGGAGDAGGWPIYDTRAAALKDVARESPKQKLRRYAPALLGVAAVLGVLLLGAWLLTGRHTEERLYADLNDIWEDYRLVRDRYPDSADWSRHTPGLVERLDAQVAEMKTLNPVANSTLRVLLATAQGRMRPVLLDPRSPDPRAREVQAGLDYIRAELDGVDDDAFHAAQDEYVRAAGGAYVPLIRNRDRSRRDAAEEEDEEAARAAEDAYLEGIGAGLAKPDAPADPDPDADPVATGTADPVATGAGDSAAAGDPGADGFDPDPDPGGGGAGGVTPGGGAAGGLPSDELRGGGTGGTGGTAVTGGAAVPGGAGIAPGPPTPPPAAGDPPPAPVAGGASDD